VTSTANPVLQLFPFLTPYAVWTGSCSQENPAFFNPDYFTTGPGEVATAPATAATMSPAMQQAALQGTVKDRNAAVLKTTYTSTFYATVRPDPNDTTPCVETYRLRNFAATTAMPAATKTTYANGGLLGQWRSSNASDVYTPAGLPFGKYDICGKYLDTSNNRTYYGSATNVDLSAMPGSTANLTLSSTTAPAGLTCP
jgi:hypothetical protein